jgi:diguanylate cyclase (GGDEF)-like protein
LLELAVGMASPFLQIGRLRRLSRVDPLTGALNRRGLDEVFPEEDAGQDEPISLVLVDIDHFKLVNDDHGHAAGDDALLAVVHRLGASCRKGDAVVRLGGEEFVLVLPGARVLDAERIAERARRAVEASPIVTSAGPLPITISAGVAERRPGESKDSLLRRADEAMYEAKHQGRNRVVLASLTSSRPPAP